MTFSFTQLFKEDPKERVDIDDSDSDDGNGSDESDGGSDDDGPGPLHSTGIFEDSVLNLHLSDETIDIDGEPQPGTSFGAYRERKRTDSVNNSESSATPRGSFDADGSHPFGSSEIPQGGFGASASSSSARHSSTGTSLDGEDDDDDVFLKPDSRDRSARSSRTSSRQASPTRRTPQRSRKSSPVPGSSQGRRSRTRSRSNMREDLAEQLSSKYQCLIHGTFSYHL